MEQLNLFLPKCYAVGEINRFVRLLLEEDPALQNIWVSGEISGISRPASGHVYFTLKDASASIRAVMWREAAAHVRLPLEGEAVEVHGRISLYEAGGQYQLYADAIQPAGQGLLFAEFQRLKAALEQEGLFDQDRKVALPAWPHKIAVVTSATGAAWQDVQQVLNRRFPLANLLLAPTPVQGTDAPAKIVAALRAADNAHADVILLVRGGGSLEDLWSFNDEGVVRAVAATRTPIVTGVGHETDFTLVDFAADLRAPTPSAAAEMISPDREALLQSLQMLDDDLQNVMRDALLDLRSDLRAQETTLRIVSPTARLQNVRQQLDEWAHRAQSAAEARVGMARTEWEGARRLLESVNPTAILSRGYALVWAESDTRLIHSTKQVSADVELKIQLADGILHARTEKSEQVGGKESLL
jgi:exodeoxyribonuclease VII large subunit